MTNQSRAAGAAALAEAAGALAERAEAQGAAGLPQGDLFARCAGVSPWDALREAGYYAYGQEVQTIQGPEVVVDGRRMVMCGSNNYLGLAGDPRVREAAVRALEQYGVGMTGSRFLNGTASLHVKLERRLARFHRRPGAVVFSQGYLANLGVLSGLCGPGDTVVLDRTSHASLLDACRLAQVKVRRFRHSDPAHLDRVLADVGDSPKLVAVDGVYSMHGDVAPLPEILEVCRRRGARLLVDEAHGVGVMGKTGRGAVEHFGLEQEVDLVVGTFSKSFGTVGGYAVGSAEVMEFIRHAARPYIFTASAPPPMVAAALEALEIIAAEPGRRARLWANAGRLLGGLRQLGFDTGLSQTPIVPVLTRSPEATMRMWRGLTDEGVFVNPVLPPAVVAGHCVLRVTAMATHTDEHIDRALDAFRRVGRAVGLVS